MQRSEVIRKAIDTYGEKNQIVVAIEELSELQKELTKEIRGKGNKEHVAEEMADVSIMLSQLSMIYKNTDKVLKWEETKLARLEETLTPKCDGDSCPIFYE